MLGNIITPLLTYFTKTEEIDYLLIKQSVKRLMDKGIDSVFIGGTTGEFINLTIDERIKILQKIRQEFGHDLNIMFNITAMNPAELHKLCQAAYTCQVDAISVIPPYFHKYSEDALLSYFEKIAQKAPEIPLYLYNIPALANNLISKELLQKLLNNKAGYSGIKDSSMDFNLLQEFEIKTQGYEFELYTGNDAQLLTAIQYGCKGGIIALANVFPEKCISIYQNYKIGRIEEAKKEQKLLIQLREMIRAIRPIVVHKYMLTLLGDDSGFIRFPMTELNADQKDVIKEKMQNLGLL